MLRIFITVNIIRFNVNANPFSSDARQQPRNMCDESLLKYRRQLLWAAARSLNTAIMSAVAILFFSHMWRKLFFRNRHLTQEIPTVDRRDTTETIVVYPGHFLIQRRARKLRP